MPAIPNNKPSKVSLFKLLFLKKKNSMTTTVMGYNAPMSALNPVEICFKLHVLRPFPKTNIKKPRSVSHINSLKEGIGSFLITRKNSIQIVPAKNCLMAAI